MVFSDIFSVYGTDSEKTHRVDHPGVCPMCDHAMEPAPLFCLEHKPTGGETLLSIMFLCRHCDNTFIAHYHGNKKDYFRLAPQCRKRILFDESISALSPAFVEIYNQAAEAEALGLLELVGPGYRKSLEILLKDYLIKFQNEDAESICKMELGNCIANKISNSRLKTAASRAAWIGNDFTHYNRKFEDFDVPHLKKFIQATQYWIAAEIATAEAAEIQAKK